MTLKDLEKLVPFMQAYLDGEQVQYYTNADNPRWVNIPDDCAWHPRFIYRIKPKARECWLVWENGYHFPMIFVVKEKAEEYCLKNTQSNAHIQQVIEEI